MKYSMVRQFSNAAIDNAFTFVFKIVDFGKILNELFWGFLEILIAFFGIFYNFFMYIYYIFLFIIDRGSETSGPTIKSRRKSQKVSRIPTVSIDKTPSIIPYMYGATTSTAGNAGKAISSSVGNMTAKTAETVQKALPSLKTPPTGTGSKKPVLKSTLEFFVEFFVTVKEILTRPFIFITEFFAKRLTPVKEEEQKKADSGKRISLIDQYMKEYEKKRR